ncbi:MAG: integrase [Candidatus Bathyarchaeia archaeon]
MRPPGFEPGSLAWETALKNFKKFLLIDLCLTPKTVRGYIFSINRFLKNVRKEDISEEDIRNYLESISHYSANYRKNAIIAFRRFFRDFLKKPSVVSSFRFPPLEFKPPIVPSKEDLKRFYNALSNKRDKALFLIFASSGLRTNEILSLDLADIDLVDRIIKPKLNQSRTKRVWISFFNEEAKKALEEYLKERKDNNLKLFPMRTNSKHHLWKEARLKTGLNITPKVLRAWFCSEMAKLGIQETFIDAFCGRVPRSILARHYTDYSPERLKEIYDRANLKILS